MKDDKHKRAKQRKHSGGKPKLKPNYNPKADLEALLEKVISCYDEPDDKGNAPSLRTVAMRVADQYGVEDEQYCGISPAKIRKLLITADVYDGGETYEAVSSLHRKGYTEAQISQKLGMKKSTVNSNLPYSKVVYKADLTGGERSVGADRKVRWRKRHSEDLSEESSALEDGIVLKNN